MLFNKCNKYAINRTTRRSHFDNDETEILLIPDLEDDGEDDIDSKGESHSCVLCYNLGHLKLLLIPGNTHAMPAGAFHALNHASTDNYYSAALKMV